MGDTAALTHPTASKNESDSSEQVLSTPRKTGIFRRKSQISQNLLPNPNKRSNSVIVGNLDILSRRNMKSRIPPPTTGIFRERTGISLQPSTSTTPKKTKVLNKKLSKSNLDLECTNQQLTDNSRTSTPAKHYSNSSNIAVPSAISLNTSTNYMHKPGTIPAYLRKPNKLAVDSQLSIKFRKFNLQKKKLSEIQTTCLKQYKDIIDLQQQIQGANEFSMDKLELIAYVVPTDPLSNECQHHIICTTQSRHTVVHKQDTSVVSNEDLFTITDKSIFEFMEKQMRKMNETNFKLCQEFMDTNFKITKELKEVTIKAVY